MLPGPFDFYSNFIIFVLSSLSNFRLIESLSLFSTPTYEIFVH